jgi:hypothetical protein
LKPTPQANQPEVRASQSKPLYCVKILSAFFHDKPF